MFVERDGRQRWGTLFVVLLAPVGVGTPAVLVRGVLGRPDVMPGLRNIGVRYIAMSPSVGRRASGHGDVPMGCVVVRGGLRTVRVVMGRGAVGVPVFGTVMVPRGLLTRFLDVYSDGGRRGSLRTFTRNSPARFDRVRSPVVLTHEVDEQMPAVSGGRAAQHGQIADQHEHGEPLPAHRAGISLMARAGFFHG